MKKYLPVVLIIFVAACSGTESEKRVNGYTPELKTQADSLMHEVMEAHDVAMAKIGTLKSYKTEADKLIDSLSKKKAAVKFKESLVTMRKKLDVAEEGMQKWMVEFNMDSAVTNRAGRVEYLKEQKEKAGAVRDLLISTVKQADSILKK